MQKIRIPLLLSLFIYILILSVQLYAVDATLSGGLGDVDSNADVNIVDALMTAQYYVGLNPQGFTADAADVNGDNAINIVDALMIAQYYVGLINQFPAYTNPTSPPAVTLTIQAEDAYCNDGLVETEYAGYTGSGYVNTTNAAGTYLEWKINAATAGNVQSTFTYANGSGASRFMELTVNGSLSVTSLEFPDTGAWDIWSTRSATIYLNAGANTLRITSLDSTGAPNMDKIDLSSSGNLTTPSPAPATPTPTLPASLTIHIIGDSTACNYDSSLYPRTGWGQVLQTYFNSANITVSNKAISGRSSKSFYDEGSWTPVRDALQSGDIVMIQFGHNDEKSEDPTRYTDPYTTYQQYLSIYIDESTARGATPILLTPIHRNNWSGTSIVDSHGDYPPAMRDLASQKGVSLIDLHIKSKTLFESLGENYVTYQIFMNLTAGQYPNYPDGNADNTHFQENGADRICGLVRDSINEQNLSIKSYLIK